LRFFGYLQQAATMRCGHQVATAAQTRLRQFPTSNACHIERRTSRRDAMIGKTSAIVIISLACTVPAATPAKAQAVDQVVEMATGIAGSLVDDVLYGAGLAASAVAPLPADDARPILQPSGRLYAEEEPNCRIRQVRVWNGYRWYFRRIQICG
jgi:hypothetical protein